MKRGAALGDAKIIVLHWYLQCLVAIDLFTKNKKIRKIINDVLGSDYILSSHGANIIGPGNIPMDLHVDQWWMPLPIIPNTSYTPVSSITRKNLNLWRNKQTNSVKKKPN